MNSLKLRYIFDSPVHPDFRGLTRGMDCKPMCSRCGNDDNELMFVATKHVIAGAVGLGMREGVRFIGCKCAKCRHVTRFDDELEVL